MEGRLVWRGHCLPAWVDYNGHMNEGYYAVALGLASNDFLELIGLGASYHKSGAGTLYTLENHLAYLNEVKEGAPLVGTAQILEHDAKRLRVFYRLFVEGDESPRATMECLLLHVSIDPPKAAPFGEDALAKLAAAMAAQGEAAWPKIAGKGIALKR